MAKKIAPDKWRHFYAGIVLGLLLQLVTIFIFQEVLIAVLVSFAVVVAISYGFELFSKFTGMGHYDIWDAIASIIGGVLGMFIVYLIAQVW